MSLTQDALQYLDDRRRPVILLETELERLIVTGGGKLETLKRTDVSRRSRRLETLDDLINYFLVRAKELEQPEVPQVFVGATQIVAVPRYQEPNESLHVIKTALEISPELNALLQLAKGVDVKTAFSLLMGDLDGCLSLELLLAISQLNVSSSGQDMLEVSPLGNVSGSSSSKLRISSGTNNTDVKNQWEFEGPFFQCDERKQKLQCVLEINVEKDDGRPSLVLTLTPRGLSRALRDARRSIAVLLAEKLPTGSQVVCGEYQS
jgi:hypothetical protein